MISVPLDDLSLNELSRVKLTLFDINSIMEGLDKLTDREVGILAGSLLDGMLEQAIRSRFARDDTDIFDGSKALSGMGAKIGLAHALGILSESSKSDVVGVNKIRNALAHAPREVTFMTRAVADRCRNLRITTEAEFIAELLPFKYESKVTPGNGIVLTDVNGNVGIHTTVLTDISPRSLFLNSVRLNMLLLFWHAHAKAGAPISHDTPAPTPPPDPQNAR